MARVGRAADADGLGPDRVKQFNSGAGSVHGAASHNAELGGRKCSRASVFNGEQRLHQPGLPGRFSQRQAARPAKSSGSLPRVRRRVAPPPSAQAHYFLFLAAFFLRSAQ